MIRDISLIENSSFACDVSGRAEPPASVEGMVT